MSQRYYPTLDQPTLEALLKRLYEEQATGFISRVEVEGFMSIKEQGLSIDEKINRVLYDLCFLDPVTYDPAILLPVTRTRVSFQGQPL